MTPVSSLDALRTTEQHRPPAPGFDPGPGPGEEPSLRAMLLQYWHAVARRRLLIAGILLVSLAAGLGYTLLQPQLYTASSRIEISRAKKNITNVQGVDDAAGSQYDYEFFETQYHLLKADSLAERVARNLDLARNPAFFAAHGIDIAADVPTRPLDRRERKRREELAARLLDGHVRIDPVKESSLVDITYTSRDPAISARIANAWPKEYIASTMDREYASNADARRFLEGMLTELRAKLEQSERDVVNYTTNRGIVTLGGMGARDADTPDPRTLVESDLEALNSALTTARADRITAQARIAASGEDESPQVVADASISNLRARRAELRAEYERMLVNFQPAYPGARALKAQIDALDTAVERETRRVAGTSRILFEEARRREAALQDEVNTLKLKLDQQQQDSIQKGIYQREADTNRQLYDALLQRYKEIGVAGAVGSSNTALVDQAKPPGSPSSPDLSRNLMLALAAGLVLSCLVVFGLEQIDERVRDPGTIAQELKLALLGNVPRTEREPLVDLGNVASPLSEAYFSIRTTLAFATVHGLPRSIVVTSTQPSEGKSTTALGLAIAIGRTGKRVLLIDADMRSPSAHGLVRNDNSKGLSNLLTGEDNYAGLVTATDWRGVSVLTSGPNPPSAAELLGSDRLADVLERLLRDYDHLMIDGPPVLGLADAPLLGRAVEGSIFVVEANRTTLSSIRHSVDRLRSVNSHIFGAIVTKLEPGDDHYGYDYRYRGGPDRAGHSD